MSIQIAGSSMFGLGLQTGLGTVQSTNGNFYYYPFTGLAHGPQQPVVALPPESGRDITPRSFYKQGLWCAGAVNLLPRLDHDFGWILHAGLGANTLLEDTYFKDTPVVVTGTDIAFVAADKHITDVSAGLGVFAVGDRITVTGSDHNDGEHIVTTAAAGVLDCAGSTFVEEEAGATVTLTCYMTGATAGAGSHVHQFRYAAAQDALPYLTTRRMLHNSDTPASSLGEVGQDNHIGTMEFSLPATGPLSASLEMVGRIPTWVADPITTWATAGVTYDDDDTFALGIDEYSMLQINGATLKATGCVVSLVNNLMSADQTRIYGSPYPVDFPVLSRGGSVRMTALCETYGLYQSLFTGAETLGGTYTANPLRGNFRLRGYSPKTFAKTSGTANYVIEFLNGLYGTEDNVVWSLQGAIQLAPQQPIILSLIGQLERNPGGSLLTVNLQNDFTTTYALA